MKMPFHKRKVMLGKPAKHVLKIYVKAILRMLTNDVRPKTVI